MSLALLELHRSRIRLEANGVVVVDWVLCAAVLGLDLTQDSLFVVPQRRVNLEWVVLRCSLKSADLRLEPMRVDLNRNSVIGVHTF